MDPPLTLDTSMITPIDVRDTYIQLEVIDFSGFVNGPTQVSPSPVLTTNVVPKVSASNTP